MLNSRNTPSSTPTLSGVSDASRTGTRYWADPVRGRGRLCSARGAFPVERIRRASGGKLKAQSRLEFRRTPAVQKVTTSLMAAVASAGTTLRATKSSQFLNFALVRASTMALERAGPICGSLSSSAAAAVLRLVLTACGAVAAPVVAGFAGAVTAGAGFAACPGWVPCAKAGADTIAIVSEVTRTRGVNIAIVLSVVPHGLMRAKRARKPGGRYA